MSSIPTDGICISVIKNPKFLSASLTSTHSRLMFNCLLNSSNWIYKNYHKVDICKKEHLISTPSQKLSLLSTFISLNGATIYVIVQAKNPKLPFLESFFPPHPPNSIYEKIK